MKPLFVTLALSSAFLHAGWNTFVKVATDRLIAIATISLGFSVVGALMIPIYGIPNQRAWGYLVLSTCFYYGYLWPLNEAYRIGDLSHTYPLFQGAAPLFVAIGAALFGRDWLSPLGFLGVLVASLGIMSLGVFGKMKTRHTTRGLYVLTLATSLVIATMMVSNALGARASGSPLAFIAWILFLQAPVVAVVAILRGAQFFETLQSKALSVALVGICATLAYGLSIYASAYAPMAGVASLRQTSVVIAALFGAVFLGETPWLPQLAAAGIIAVGSILVATQGTH